jgi:hypothetical protein
MPWTYRLIQDGEGWACRLGRTEYDRHSTLPAALIHIAALAAAVGCDDIRLHHKNGTVERFLGQQTAVRPSAEPDR